MKRTVLFALMISLLLCGCAAREEDEDALRRQQDSWRQSEIEFAASVMTQTEETAYSYEAACRYAAGETQVTLTAPENIAGVRFRTDGEQSALAYDGAELLLGEPDSDLPPAMAVPLMMEAMTDGYLLRIWREEDYLVAELETDEDETVTLWLTEGHPVCAQIQRDGYTAAQLKIEHWQQKEV